MKEISGKLSKLIDVKSIMTLLMTFGFLILVFNKSVEGKEFIDIYKMIVIFYFGVQYEKNAKG